MTREDPQARERRLRRAAEIAATGDVAQPESDEPHTERQRRTDHRGMWVEIQIQQAMRAGAFDDLPGSGKPIPGVDSHHDPDWWLKQLIEREKISGLLPPALALRTEDARLDDELDQLTTPVDVRRVLEDFNARIIDARRQLQGGPPVITPLRDVDAEVATWMKRRADRAERQRLRLAEIRADETSAAPPTWWRRLLPRPRAGHRRRRLSG